MTGIPPDSWVVDPQAASAFELMPGFWRLRLPVAWHHVSHVNSYLIDGGAGDVTLIDCGSGGDPSAQQALEVALAKTGRGIADVRDLILTHYHTDHMGLCGPIKEISGATVWGHAKHDDFFEVIDEPRQAAARRRAIGVRGGAEGELLEAVASVQDELQGTDHPVPPDRLLIPGETVATALDEWEIVLAQGHCPSQVCLSQPQQRLLISADLLMGEFVSFCDVGSTPDPIAEFQQAIERVAALEVETAFPGHGRPIADTGALVQLYREGFASRLSAFEQALDQRPTNTAALAIAVLGETDQPATGVWRFLGPTATSRISPSSSAPPGSAAKRTRRAAGSRPEAEARFPLRPPRPRASTLGGRATPRAADPRPTRRRLPDRAADLRHLPPAASRTLDELVAHGQHPLAPDAARTLPVLGGSGMQLARVAARQGRGAELLGLLVRTLPGRGAAARARAGPLARHDGTVLGVTYLDASPDSRELRRQYHLTYPNLRDTPANSPTPMAPTSCPRAS